MVTAFIFQQKEDGHRPVFKRPITRSIDQICIPERVESSQGTERTAVFTLATQIKIKMQAQAFASAGLSNAIANHTFARRAFTAQRPAKRVVAVRKSGIVASAQAAAPTSPFAAVQSEEQLFALLKGGASSGQVMRVPVRLLSL